LETEVFETPVTIVGNALNDPQVRRIMNDQTTVTNFKVASTARRYDRLTNSWVDGVHLRVRVNCWRRLAENVSECIRQGDPVVVTGRLHSRDWVGEDKVKRVSYELDAVAVGHDLARGVDRFSRTRTQTGVSATEDEETEARVHGALTEPVDEPLLPSYDEALSEIISSAEQEEDPFAFEPALQDAPAAPAPSPSPSPEDAPAPDEETSDESSPKRRKRTPVPV
jgi:single-strand DNA-binding protein